MPRYRANLGNQSISEEVRAIANKFSLYSKSPGPCALAGSTPASGTNETNQLVPLSRSRVDRDSCFGIPAVYGRHPRTP